MKRNSAILVAPLSRAWLMALPCSAVLTALASLDRPLRAQAVEDWSTAPIAIPAAPAGGSIMPTDPGSDSAPPPRREIQLPPAELRRPQAPLLPGETPSIRIAPGEGVRPLPVIPRPASPQTPSTVRPKAGGSVAVPARPTPTPLPVTPPTLPRAVASPPAAASPRRLPSAAVRPSSTPFPSLLESLPPGTIRPLPGETLPGATPPSQSGPASASPLQGMPAPPPPPQAVPPPPWLDRKAQGVSEANPWSWLLLGLGIGGTAVFLLKERRPQAPVEGPLDALGIRIVARADSGVQTLRAAAPLVAEPPGAGPGP